MLVSLYQFKWEVTLGDIALGVIGAIVTGILALYRVWLPRYPFTLRFYDKPWDTDDEDNPSTDCKTVHCSQGEPQKMFIGIRLRTKREFKTIDIRLVERHWRFWPFACNEAPKQTVQVMGIRDQQHGDFKVNDNKKNGRELTYLNVINDLPRGAIMWYEVTVSAVKDWNGWLSFQLRRGSSHKGIAQGRLCFKIINEGITNEQ